MILTEFGKSEPGLKNDLRLKAGITVINPVNKVFLTFFFYIENVAVGFGTYRNEHTLRLEHNYIHAIGIDPTVSCQQGPIILKQFMINLGYIQSFTIGIRQIMIYFAIYCKKWL